MKFLSENGTIEFRHYAIQSRLGAKKKIQNLLNSNKEIPDLGKYNSIEEYMNAMSGSGPRIHMVHGMIRGISGFNEFDQAYFKSESQRESRTPVDF